MFEDTFERTRQFMQLAIVIAQQIPTTILESVKDVQYIIDNPGKWGPSVARIFKLLLATRDLHSEFEIVEVLAPEGKFIVSDHFRQGNSAGVKFREFSDTDLAGLPTVEDNVEAESLKIRSLKQPWLGFNLYEALGRPETPLAHIWQLLSKQPNGEPGILTTEIMMKLPPGGQNNFVYKPVYFFFLHKRKGICVGSLNLICQKWLFSAMDLNRARGLTCVQGSKVIGG